MVLRSIFFILLLTLTACHPVRTRDSAETTEDPAASAEVTSASTDGSDTAYSTGYAQQQITRELAQEQYALIGQWLRHEGLHGFSHAELETAAATNVSASRYIDCHEASKMPTATDSRLGLLSTCLTTDADIASQIDDPNRRLADTGAQASALSR